jgi:hypothetical protein
MAGRVNIKSVILKGIEVKVGDKVRFIDDRNIYDCGLIVNPELGKVYTVSGFSKGYNGGLGFYLEEVKNGKFPFSDGQGDVDFLVPGFAIWRFEPATPLADSISEVNSEEIKKAFEKLIEIALPVFE